MKKNILAENMRRFKTKNLNEDEDQNNNGYPDGTEREHNSKLNKVSSLDDYIKGKNSSVTGYKLSKSTNPDEV